MKPVEGQALAGLEQASDCSCKPSAHSRHLHQWGKVLCRAKQCGHACVAESIEAAEWAAGHQPCLWTTRSQHCCSQAAPRQRLPSFTGWKWDVLLS